LTKLAQTGKDAIVPDDDELITARELSERSGTPLSTLNRWVREGRIEPALKLPGKTGAYLFAADTVLDLSGDAA
jgi:predicted site-specific integrase-resolvase